MNEATSTDGPTRASSSFASEYGDPSGRASYVGTNVVLFSAYYPAHGGGMELACADLAVALANANMHVEWVSQATGEIPREDGIKFTPLPGTDFVYSLSGVPVPFPMPWAFPAMRRAMERADVVLIAEANFAVSAIAFLMAKWNGKPVLLVQHVGEPSTVSKVARFVMRLGEALVVRPMIRCADAVVCVSPVVARHFAGVRTDSDCVTIGHGLDLELFRPSAGLLEKKADRDALNVARDKPVAAFVGRLTESKGVLAVAEMARRRPDWTFVVAGIGPIDPARWELPNVLVTGQLNRMQVARLYRASDVALLPSPSESFSLVVREALASGCRVLCSEQILETDEGLRPYIVTEKVDSSDWAGTGVRYAAAIDRRSAATLEEARAYVAEQCSPDRIFGQYVELIQRLFVRASGGRS
ncbi:glycosyltransferase family 4 protein [Sphingopyxis sp. RIFCSPHIGHO2_12_FULL_65_19]|uniref:glycosyltransferase family 4 protein n=1 Tax=Sphingopyxis sp. RIFCSPHIGHO2_12_FULL_65_19 TaxID=1802172 RepID=UPI0025D00E8D|nr:glycosyltransferase family 4 protein [Sphingopyxis sp. RIFCSPHIGHO2_12_FULL_65_19]